MAILISQIGFISLADVELSDGSSSDGISSDGTSSDGSSARHSSARNSSARHSSARHSSARHSSARHSSGPHSWGHRSSDHRSSDHRSSDHRSSDHQSAEVNKYGIPAEYAEAGKLDLDKMRRNADLDCKEADEVIKNLTPSAGRPSIDYQTLMWVRRLQHVREVVYGLDNPQTTPTGSELEHFLNTIPSIMDSRRNDGAISYWALQDGLSLLRS
ncbi:hypothetical protein PG994_001198 [Apiospora phragmitis]|uniref:Uncharacterized protein n=1 Tax=Apiospora phragmitis TaxID=2905665 RepID=A0ABR1WSV2_9PEZI